MVYHFGYCCVRSEKDSGGDSDIGVWTILSFSSFPEAQSSAEVLGLLLRMSIFHISTVRIWDFDVV